MPDWLAAWDALISGRVTQCLLCGRQPAELHVGVQDLARHSVAFCLCPRCVTQPAVLETVARVLAQRYADARGVS